MTDLILLSEAQMARISPFFPRSHGVPRVDDRRVISGIIFVIRNGLRWRDVPASYGPHKTIYNRFVRQCIVSAPRRCRASLAIGLEPMAPQWLDRRASSGSCRRGGCSWPPATTLDSRDESLMGFVQQSRPR